MEELDNGQGESEFRRTRGGSTLSAYSQDGYGAAGFSARSSSSGSPKKYALKGMNALRRWGSQTSDQIPVLSDQDDNEAPKAESEDGVTREGAKNIAVALVAVSLAMIGLSIFNDASGQWIYAEFEYKVLGSNASLVNKSIATNPCIHGDNDTSPWAKELDEAQALAARFNIWTMLISLVPAVFTNVLLGAYGDRIGRRILFLAPIFGIFVRIANSCAVAYWDLNLYWLFLGMGVVGITGYTPALYMAIYVYTADNTGQNKSRSFGMVLAQTTINLFYSLSHLGIGFFIKTEGYFWPMFLAMLISFSSLLVCLVFVKETLDKRKLKERAKVGQAIKGVFSFYFIKSDNPLFKRKDFIFLGAVFFMYETCLGVTIQYLFLMAEPLCWGSEKIGYVTTFQGLLSAFVTLVLMRLLQAFFIDETICIVSLISAAASRFLLAFSVSDWMIYTAFTIGMLELLVRPLVRAILSRMVAIDKRSSLFASIAVIEVATLAFAGAGFDAMYSLTVAIWGGMTYFVVASCVVLSALVMVAYIIMVRRRKSRVSHSIQEDTISETQ